MSVGSFCLVLHGHLPYVLRHGLWPHGEDWLYEAAAETYLPLLQTLGECEYLNGSPRLTVGLTPVLVEQLRHDDFKDGFERYLGDRCERARSDRKDFERVGDGHLAYLATRWEEFFERLGQQFAELGRDIPKAYAAAASRGTVELLTSAATHAYLPLLREDSCVTAQLRAGLAASKRAFGFAPGGIWLPECAYRPPGLWRPAVPWGPAKDRRGTESFLAAEGLTHFFTEHHLIEHSRSEWVRNEDWRKVDWDEAQKYPARGWRSVQEPVEVASDGRSPRGVRAFARDAEICERVWSGDLGYPADGAYLEFHKKHGERRGLRYWKVTGNKVDLGDKQRYYPDDIGGKVHEHAEHFCSQIRRTLHDHHGATGRHGVVVACFDAELFGHWWFEGPQFLRDVMLTLNAMPDVDVCTTSQFLERHPPDKAVALPEGSWGDGGDHRVWTNDRVNWMWDVEYRCESLFGKLTYTLPWARREDLRDVLEKAGRELLLLQASDWPFVISRGQAVDYGIKRFMQHVSRFECLIDLAEKLVQDEAYLNRITEVEQFELRDAELHDVIFADVDLDWWRL